MEVDDEPTQLPLATSQEATDDIPIEQLVTGESAVIPATPPTPLIHNANLMSTIPLEQPGTGGNRTSKVLMIVGAALLLLGLSSSAWGLSSIEDDTNVWIGEVQIDLDGGIDWNGSGQVTNETIVLGSKDDRRMHYLVMMSHDAELTNLSVTDSDGVEVFEPEDCEDSNPDDEIDDCADYRYYHIGNLVGSSGPHTVNLDSTGDVFFLHTERTFSAVEETVWDLAVKGMVIAGCGTSIGCCLGGLLLIIGTLTNSGRL